VTSLIVTEITGPKVTVLRIKGDRGFPFCGGKHSARYVASPLSTVFGFNNARISVDVNRPKILKIYEPSSTASAQMPRSVPTGRHVGTPGKVLVSVVPLRTGPGKPPTPPPSSSGGPGNTEDPTGTARYGEMKYGTSPYGGIRHV
jgi:hypothetical protein